MNFSKRIEAIIERVDKEYNDWIKEMAFEVRTCGKELAEISYEMTVRTMSKDAIYNLESYNSSFPELDNLLAKLESEPKILDYIYTLWMDSDSNIFSEMMSWLLTEVNHRSEKMNAF